MQARSPWTTSLLRKFLENISEIAEKGEPRTTHPAKRTSEEQNKIFLVEAKGLRHPVFSGGHPSRYWPGSQLLNFSDRTGTGAFKPDMAIGTRVGFPPVCKSLEGWRRPPERRKDVYSAIADA